MRHALAILVRSLVVVWLSSASGASAVELAWPSGTRPPRVSAVPESRPVWQPTDSQIEDVRATAEAFFAAKDTEQAAGAYKLQTDSLKQTYPIDKYTEDLLKFHRLSGDAKKRQVIAVTWSKDPAQAPAPGIYATLDFVAQFENIDRYCGYLILYQPPTGGPFLVAHEQFAFLDNATAKSIEQHQGPAGADDVWAKMSARMCPNYRKTPPLPEQAGSSIGYPTVEAALKALHANPAVVFSNEAGWTVALDRPSRTKWAFAPAGNPAYPAAVKRQIVQDDAGLRMEMHVLCGGPKEACDDLVRQFNEINAKSFK
jgi:hypothetical protein